MSTPQHTPGPWSATASHCNSWDIRDACGFQLYFIGCGTGYPKDEHAANARLIAASPEGFEFAQAFLSKGKTGISLESLEQMALAYVSKATGKEPS